MSVYMIGGHIVGVAGAVCATGGGGGTFTPAGSQTMTGTIADGQAVTLNGSGFGTKPNASNPLIWAPGNSATPSSYGRITSAWYGYAGSGLVATASGGPYGAGYYSGAANPGPGGTGVQTGWAIGFDVDSDPNWSSYAYAINSYGQKMCVSTKVLRHAMGYLQGDGSSPGQYNTKNFRCWARTGAIGSGEATPDFYSPPCNGRFDVEAITVDWSPGPDYNSDPTAIGAYENVQDTWLQHENLVQSNSNSSTADANYQWIVLGTGLTFQISNITQSSSCVVTSSSTQSTNPFQNTNGNNEQQLTFGGVGGMTQINGLIGSVTAAGGSAGAWTATVRINTSAFSAFTSGGVAAYMPWNFPNTSYQLNQWKFLNSSISGLTNAVNGGGNILRMYPAHYIVDGTSGRANAPLGGYINYADVFVDDSWYGVWITDSTNWTASTVREPQIVAPSGWSTTSINLALLRKGVMTSGQKGYVWTTDVNRTPTLQGYVTWP
jgi:hypothetical protein